MSQPQAPGIGRRRVGSFLIEMFVLPIHDVLVQSISRCAEYQQDHSHCQRFLRRKHHAFGIDPRPRFHVELFPLGSPLDRCNTFYISTYIQRIGILSLTFTQELVKVETTATSKGQIYPSSLRKNSE